MIPLSVTGEFTTDMQIALTMVFFVWILNWSKANLGSAKLAIIFAAILTYFTFYKHSSLILVVVVIVILATIGKGFVSKAW